jgi:hypothetical protein
MNITGSVGNMYQGAIQTRPYDFGTDAIERQRVSAGQSLIDADFEYGLQATKWQTFSEIRKYPSFFEIPGSDIVVTGISADTSTPATITVSTAATTPTIPVVGSIITVQGVGAGNYSDRVQGSFIVTASISGTSFSYQAKGAVLPTGTNIITSYTVVRKGGYYNASSSTAGNCKLPVSGVPVVSTGTVLVTTSSAHGLIAGTPIAVTGWGGVTAINGNWIVLSVLTPTTFTFFVSGASGTVTNAGSTGAIYVQSYSYAVHRPFDGGVLISPAIPAYGATSVRQSKKVFRYQSGKGLIWSSGTLFCPNNDISSIVVGSNVQQIVVTTSIPHGSPQAGATIQIRGVTTPGVNGTYTVTSIQDSFNVILSVTTGLAAGAVLTLGDQPRFIIYGWHGSSVRVGTFDDQNGLFWEWDGQTLWVVKRSSTFQITGLSSCAANSTLLTGTGTRFGQQFKVGDKFTMRGMTHTVTSIIGDTQLTFNPPYRGASSISSSQPVTVCKIKETRVPQSQFNRDTIDGKGPSGFNIDVTKMQMMGLQYTWYGAGFIDFMVRGADGNFVFAHRFKQNNINDEAYMRTGNMPVRYEIANETIHAVSTLSSPIDQFSTTSLSLNDPITYWPTAGTVLIDNELVTYSGKTGNTLTGLTRASTITYNINDVSSSLSHGSSTYHIGGTTGETVISLSGVTPTVISQNIAVSGITIDASYVGSVVVFGGTWSTGITANTPYYIISVTSQNTFIVSGSSGGAPITPTVPGAGTFYLYKNPASVTSLGTVTPTVSGNNITVPGISLDSSFINSVVTFGASFTGGSAVPAANTPYYIISVGTSYPFTVSTTLGGPQLTLSGPNTGTFYLYKNPASVIAPGSVTPTVSGQTITVPGLSLDSSFLGSVVTFGTNFTTGITAGTPYYIVSVVVSNSTVVSYSNTFIVSTTLGGAPITPTGPAAGTFYLYKTPSAVISPGSVTPTVSTNAITVAGVTLDSSFLGSVVVFGASFGTGIVAGTPYYILTTSTANPFTVSTSSGGGVLTVGTAGASGTFYLYKNPASVTSLGSVTPTIGQYNTINVTGLSLDSSYTNSVVFFGSTFGNGIVNSTTPYYIFSVLSSTSFIVSGSYIGNTPVNNVAGPATSGTFTLYKTPASVNLVSLTCCPSLTHWGSAFIMDGLFDQDRGYLFNYQVNNFGIASPLAAGSTFNLFLLRLSPSVSNGVIGDIGTRDLLNRAQLLLQRLDVWAETGSAATNQGGSIVISGILNPSFSTTNIIPAATNWFPINSSTYGSQPSFAQVCNFGATAATNNTVGTGPLTVGTYVAGSGERVFSTINNAGSQNSIDLSGLKEICNSVIGGNNFFPDGPDTLLIQMTVPTGAATIANYSVNLFWGEAQA